MNKTKFLLIIIVVLLLTNAVLVFQLFRFAQNRKDPKSVITQKLNFDEEQSKSYEKFIQKHRSDVNENEARLNAHKSALYATLKFNADCISVDSILTLITAQQEAAEMINYKHFLEIKSLCKPEQQADFNELTNEILTLFSRKGRK